MPNRRRWPFLLSMLPATACLCGCGELQYLVQQAVGEIEVITHSEPIDEVLAGGGLDPEQEAKLRLIVAAREFARDTLGLDVGRSFSRYHDTGGEPVMYSLTACRPDRLAPKTWWFPIAGTVDSLVFFSEAEASARASELAAAGYDTYVFGTDAYSTLGWFPDPVHSRALNRSDGSLAETVFHECAHNTVFAPGQPAFNESLATFVGRLGARLFFEQRGEEGGQIVAELERDYADQQRITAWVLELIGTLTQYYAQDLTYEEKVSGREAVFQAARDRFLAEVQPLLNNPRYAWWAEIPTNNAFVLVHRRYNLDLAVFAETYERCGGDMRAFLDTLRAAAARPDAFAYLRSLGGSP